jgi:hypothetical protein
MKTLMKMVKYSVKMRSSYFAVGTKVHVHRPPAVTLIGLTQLKYKIKFNRHYD